MQPFYTKYLRKKGEEPIQSWGNYPKMPVTGIPFKTIGQLQAILSTRSSVIPFGNGRSYGDSALNKTVICCKSYNQILHFDQEAGVIRCQSGVLLSEIIELSVPKGWFLRVTPGTKWVSVGGAIASDVHGKNHHIEGCFSQCVDSLRVMIHTGEIITCSATQHPELFRATCGGMGLTGVILEATLSLKKIQSCFILQDTIQTQSLQETFDLFEASHLTPYSVAWVDCLATGKKMGKSIVMLGQFAQDGDLRYTPKKKITIPWNFPSFILNWLSIRMFNTLYYLKNNSTKTPKKVDIDTFFYPLDQIEHWNRIYGKNGLIQYQFILPKAQSQQGITAILTALQKSPTPPCLGVLKLYGKANDNYISFPLEGYSLAIDFKVTPALFPFLDTLDTIVLAHGGRLYLAKDARVSKSTFEKGYPNLQLFKAHRPKESPFESRQSRRLGGDSQRPV